MKRFRLSLILILALVTGCCAAASAAQAAPLKKWRAVYVEGGGYTDYQQILAATAQGLAKLGLIEHGDVPIPTDADDTRPMWDWLAEHAGGERIEFLKDGYYSAGWDEKRRAENKKATWT